MIEVIMLNFLTEHLSVPVYTEHQEEMPECFVIFEKTSGGKKNHLNQATLAIQSYGQSLEEAAFLNEEVKTVVEKMIGLPSISKVELNSDYNFTDTETKRYRYQAVVDFIYF
ncbi:hypothetical protein [Streptococcus suis]|uniref:hypothetical protein n=1 Tax=Streptococcus suis TaxID=1307 RepID=UPI00040B841B|nr:hypothetical protein [Streptococcus suis]AUC92133.1 hypothetical protein CWM22_09615 [Streptococcus suis]AZR96807.1 hypothetical protein A7J10_02685 [Streptococcus suis]KPA68274.1 hypothetical protein XK27_02890 [Streptococcus suis]QTA56283.1 hypothetical protein J1N58_08265 [Streptococcus suis]HEM6413141.1 hypothetical protein [Streptococcus suis]